MTKSFQTIVQIVNWLGNGNSGMDAAAQVNLAQTYYLDWRKEFN